MSSATNRDVAARLDEVARLLRDQGRMRFALPHISGPRQQCAASTSRSRRCCGRRAWRGCSVCQASARRSRGRSAAGSRLGRLPMPKRLRGESDAVALLASVPGIGPVLAERLHGDLQIDTLEQLEAAAHDGRLASIAGLGEKRLAGIRDSVAARLARLRPPPDLSAEQPSVEELLGVDREYRREAAAGRLRRIAPRRFNPERRAWLPLLHTERGLRQYTALFSNTARAHELGRTQDWVVLYVDGGQGERQYTVVTARRGVLGGRRVVRGREAECLNYYRERGLKLPVGEPEFSEL
jgi:DNA polymerase (family X)